jgi:hypothetical protein
MINQFGNVNELKSSNFHLKKDKFRNVRDGNSKLLEISCSKCNKRLMIYQKDGIGTLLRSYLDRILWPEKLASLSNDSRIRETKDIPNLSCEICNSLIGIPIVYAPERRLAFRLIRGTFRKQKLK